jgi:hypothetical protein
MLCIITHYNIFIRKAILIKWVGINTINDELLVTFVSLIIIINLAILGADLPFRSKI